MADPIPVPITQPGARRVLGSMGPFIGPDRGIANSMCRTLSSMVSDQVVGIAGSESAHVDLYTPRDRSNVEAGINGILMRFDEINRPDASGAARFGGGVKNPPIPVEDIPAVPNAQNRDAQHLMNRYIDLWKMLISGDSAEISQGFLPHEARAVRECLLDIQSYVTNVIIKSIGIWTPDVDQQVGTGQPSSANAAGSPIRVGD